MTNVREKTQGTRKSRRGEVIIHEGHEGISVGQENTDRHWFPLMEGGNDLKFHAKARRREKGSGWQDKKGERKEYEEKKMFRTSANGTGVNGDNGD
jgi:hypothetical protein